MADPPTSGLSVARQMAMISYRNAKVHTLIMLLFQTDIGENIEDNRCCYCKE